MNSREEQAKKLARSIISTIFHNKRYIYGLQTSCSMFTVRPNKERGHYLVSGDLDAATAALAQLHYKQANGYMTPKKLKKWFNAWAVIIFVREQYDSDPLPTNYHSATDVAVRVVIEYDAHKHDCMYHQLVFSVISQPMSDELQETNARHFEQELLDAGFPAPMIEWFKMASLDSDHPRLPESMAAAEKVLGRTDCYRCHEPATKKCAGCMFARYCSKACQVAEWKEHKPMCPQFKFMGKSLENMASGISN